MVTERIDNLKFYKLFSKGTLKTFVTAFYLIYTLYLIYYIPSPIIIIITFSLNTFIYYKFVKTIEYGWILDLCLTQRFHVEQEEEEEEEYQGLYNGWNSEDWGDIDIEWPQEF